MSGLLLRVSIDDDGCYMVTDLVGSRYGYATTLAEALTDWSENVDGILAIEEPLGEPLKFEVAAYRKALNR